MVSNNEFMTASDVAREADVTPAAVREWERTGKLPAERTAGGVRLFRRADVDLVLAARLAKAESR